MLVECPVSKLSEISGFNTCRACVCECVRHRDREYVEYSYGAVKLTRRLLSSKGIFLKGHRDQESSFYFFWLTFLPHEVRLWRREKHKRSRCLAFSLVIRLSISRMSSKWRYLKITRTQECLVPASRQVVEGCIGKVFSLACWEVLLTLLSILDKQCAPPSAIDLRCPLKSSLFFPPFGHSRC